MIAYIRGQRESGTRLVTMPQVQGPGEEAGVDFGEATLIVAGSHTEVQLFHLYLSRSGRAVHVAFTSVGQEALLEGHVRRRGSDGLVRSVS